MIMVRPALAAPPALRLAQLGFLLLIFLLVFMKQDVVIGGLAAIPADFMFLMVVALWLLALAFGQARLRWHPAFWVLPVYFAAIGASALVSRDAAASAFKLSTQVYLLSLPILAYNLVRTADELREVLLAWLAAAAVLGLLAVATVALFPLLGPNSILAGSLHHYGTLPPGNYPRIELTFVFPAMLANFLTVSLIILLISARLGWVPRRLAPPLGAGILVGAFFALTPGFGGLLLAAGLWCGLVAPVRDKRLARLALVAGIAGGIAFTLAATVTPILHDNAPFLISLPGLPPLAPSVRLLAWMDALRAFLDSPLLGRGIGIDPANVPFIDPSGAVHYVTDPHNVFLSVAAQCGVLGLAGLLLLILAAVRLGRPFTATSAMGPARAGLAVAFLCAFAFEGLVGSFEDARHLWILFGLIAVASTLDPRRAEGPSESA